jgi:hypothetical protein
MNRSHAKVGLGLGTIVETQHGQNSARQLSRELDSAFTDAVLNAVDDLLVKLDSECPLDVVCGAGQLHRPAHDRSRIVFHLQVEFLCECLHHRYRIRVGGVVLLVLCAADAHGAIGAASAFVDLQLLFALHNYRYGNFALRRRSLHMDRIFRGRLLASFEYYACLLRKVRIHLSGGTVP